MTVIVVRISTPPRCAGRSKRVNRRRADRTDRLLTWEQAQQWRDAGIQQVVYHRSRDAQAAGVAWGEADITAIKRLSDMGFKVTVTGGLALEDLPLFKGIPIHVFRRSQHP
ncbi:3-keto-L-gulonate-6-phosphate decarboxylase [Escherichia coli]|uniref:3-keto-L-gulonate-6-phosphate decarboxylase n=1 Tax=Escherichia coli TaxID=562 RepID=A0A376U181_ECOLX|nr:3-keto-L-gulonate-6-phosphate decarboxylase [Escherichia coli]